VLWQGASSAFERRRSTRRSAALSRRGDLTKNEKD
jgi:hypothetical protein